MTRASRRKRRVWRAAEKLYARFTGRDPVWLSILVDGAAAVCWLTAWRLRGRLARIRSRRKPDPGARVAFVMTWYGEDAAGGAEAEARGLIQALRTHAPEIEIEVYATTLKEFAADWNEAFHPEGTRTEDGITVHRFHAEPRDRTEFHYLNGTCLMQGGTESLWDMRGRRRSPLSAPAEAYYLRHMIYSPGLLRALSARRDQYRAVVMIPYMFTSSVLAAHVAGKRSIPIPCLHNERYAFLNVYEKAFNRAGAVLCHVRSEAALCKRLYPRAPEPVLLGEQVDTDVPPGNAERFRETYGISGPFLLYAGRQVEGKNLPLLIEWFTAWRDQAAEGEDLKLVLIGKGDLDFSNVPGVISLGYIPAKNKAGAYAAALGLTMLSLNESFSIVLMESWLQSTPAIVHAGCDVTRDHVKDARGGFAVANAEEFIQAVNRLRKSPEERNELGRRGGEYVHANYRAERIAGRFAEVLSRLTSSS